MKSFKQWLFEWLYLNENMTPEQFKTRNSHLNIPPNHFDQIINKDPSKKGEFIGKFTHPMIRWYSLTDDKNQFMNDLEQTYKNLDYYKKHKGNPNVRKAVNNENAFMWTDYQKFNDAIDDASTPEFKMSQLYNRLPQNLSTETKLDFQDRLRVWYLKVKNDPKALKEYTDNLQTIIHNLQEYKNKEDEILSKHSNIDNLTSFKYWQQLDSLLKRMRKKLWSIDNTMPKREFKLIKKKDRDYKLMYEDEEWFVVSPYNYHTSVTLAQEMAGCNDWCVGYYDEPEYFIEYFTEGNIYFFINLLDNTNSYCHSVNEFSDFTDTVQPIDTLFDGYPELKPVFKKILREETRFENNKEELLKDRIKHYEKYKDPEMLYIIALIHSKNELKYNIDKYIDALKSKELFTSGKLTVTNFAENKIKEVFDWAIDNLDYKYLVKKDSKGNAPFHYALEYPPSSAIPKKLLNVLKYDDLITKDNQGFTPFHNSIIKIPNKIVYDFIEKLEYKDLITRAKYSNTPLHLMMLYPDPEAVKKLISKLKYNDLIAKNNSDKTPLHLALQKYINNNSYNNKFDKKTKFEIIKILVDNLKPNAFQIKNNDNESCYDIATKHNMNDVLDLLNKRTKEFEKQ